MHLAVGNGFPALGGTNVSGLHWDLVKDLRQGAGSRPTAKSSRRAAAGSNAEETAFEHGGNRVSPMNPLLIADARPRASHDAGETFTDASGDLPDAPADWVLVRNGTLIVGSDVGVFISSGLTGGSYAASATLPQCP